MSVTTFGSANKLVLIAASTLAAGALALGGAALANAATTTTTTTTPATSTSSSTTPAGATAAGQSATGRAGAPGGSADTVLTGDEAAKVTAAVQAKNSTATVTSVRKDPDGSYDALATKAGSQVMFDVSADLATITENTGGPAGAAAPAAGSSASSSSAVTGAAA